jgi:hypothetical protein
MGLSFEGELYYGRPNSRIKDIKDCKDCKDRDDESPGLGGCCP